MDRLYVKCCAAPDERLGKTYGARVGSTCRSRPQDKHQALATASKEVICNCVPNSPIVDADQIVVATARILNVITVEQNDGKLCFVKRGNNATIDDVLIWDQLKRSEEYSTHSVANKSLA
jgi:hypothetical protein